MRLPDSPDILTRRAVLRSGIAAGVLLAQPIAAFAASPGFEQWREHFRTRALAKGVSEATWNRVMAHLAPDTTVFKEMGDQPEFTEEIWQYINRLGSSGLAHHRQQGSAGQEARRRCFAAHRT